MKNTCINIFQGCVTYLCHNQDKNLLIIYYEHGDLQVEGLDFLKITVSGSVPSSTGVDILKLVSVFIKV